MDNIISNNAKIQTPTSSRQDSDRATASGEVQTSPTPAGPSVAEAAAAVTPSERIQTSEAAQTALDRLKELLAQQPTAALAAYNKISGQVASDLLDSAVSTAS